MCASPLLRQSLEKFLAEHIVSYQECDLVLADRELDIDKPCLMIANSEEADIQKPFTRTQLVLALEQYFKQPENRMIVQTTTAPVLDNQDFKRELHRLTENYLQQMEDLIDSYGEKQA